MLKKRVRTISGVTVVAVMTRPMRCPHGTCIYCPGGTVWSTPQSYMPKSPAVLRAVRCGFDPFKQVAGRLRVLGEMGHARDKVELIVMGGTFLAADAAYQSQFVKGCYDGLNGFVSPGLDGAMVANETAQHRCVGLCVETRPDWCMEQHIDAMLRFGTTRVELGVQTLDDNVYRIVKRGHTIDDVAVATRLLKDSGLKVHYHFMPGLPGSDRDADVRNFKKLFSDGRFMPDGLKIYPCLVVRGTALGRMYESGGYMPYATNELVELVADMKAVVPPYVRISRVMRDMPAEYIVAGSTHSHLRDMVKAHMKERGMRCRCIRCREAGYNMLAGVAVDGPVTLHRRDYRASGGREAFLSFEDGNGILVGLLRLRMPHEPFRPEITQRTALVRELHVYGPEAAIGAAGLLQHHGYGKALLKEAERIAAEEFGAEKIAVTSGVGAREYYRKMGYEREGAYMVKMLE